MTCYFWINRNFISRIPRPLEFWNLFFVLNTILSHYLFILLFFFSSLFNDRKKKNQNQVTDMQTWPKQEGKKGKFLLPERKEREKWNTFVKVYPTPISYLKFRKYLTSPICQYWRWCFIWEDLFLLIYWVQKYIG